MTITDSTTRVTAQFIDGIMSQIEIWADANDLCADRVSHIDPFCIYVPTEHRRDQGYLQEIQRELEKRQAGTTRCEDLSIIVGQTVWSNNRKELIIKIIP